MCLVVGDSLLVVDAAVQGDVESEGQESHGVRLPGQGGLLLRVGSSKGLDIADFTGG